MRLGGIGFLAYRGDGPMITRKGLLTSRGIAAGLLLLIATGGAAAETDSGHTPVGRIELHTVQAAWLGSGTSGEGTLYFRGKKYPLRIGGLGIGGFGVSKIEATGNVYDLTRVEDFPGAFGQARTGWAVGQAGSGRMWLQNDRGVVLQLKAKRKGLMLSLGADALVIQMAD